MQLQDSAPGLLPILLPPEAPDLLQQQCLLCLQSPGSSCLYLSISSQTQLKSLMVQEPSIWTLRTLSPPLFTPKLQVVSGSDCSLILLWITKAQPNFWQHECWWAWQRGGGCCPTLAPGVHSGDYPVKGLLSWVISARALGHVPQTPSPQY